MKQFLIHIVISVITLLPVNSLAKSLINSADCIIGNSTDPSPVIKVSTIGNKCYTTCQQYCAEKFKIDSASFSQYTVSDKKSDFMLMKSNIISSNRDRIEMCINECFKGSKSDQKIRIPTRVDSATGTILDDDGSNPYPWKCDIYSSANDIAGLSCEDKTGKSNTSRSSVCSQSDLQKAYFDGGVRLYEGSSIVIKLADSVSTTGNSTSDDLTGVDGNNIYLCGFNTVIYSPNYTYGSNYVPGTNGIGLFSPRLHSIYNPLSTGIIIRNNDYLSINYSGRYYSKCTNPTGCDINDEDFKLGLTIFPWNMTVPVRDKNDQNDSQRSQIAQLCEPCSKNNSLAICSTNQCKNKSYAAAANGLVGNVNWISNPKLFAKKLNPDDSESQFRVTTISGNLTGLQSTQEIKIYYPQSQNTSSGGYFVSMSWKGCRYQNGQRLQYIIVNDAILNSDFYNFYMNDDNNWTDLPMKNVNGVYSANVNVNSGNLSIPSMFNNDGAVSAANKNQGKIFLRIKPLSQSEAQSLGATLYGRENSLGQYYLKIDPSPTKSIPGKLIDLFYEMLKDVANAIFNGFQKNQDYLKIVRLVLVLYVAMTGLMFMVGMANITQNEAVTRVFKISIVVMLLSPDSFAFFNQNLFKIFSFDTMNSLANLFTPQIDINFGGDLQTNSSGCFNNSEVKVSLICVLESDLKMFFSWAFWNRIIGLLISGLFLPAVAIIAGVFMYCIIVLKITFMFCIAMLALTVTISLAPLFIPMILFKYTKSFFDSWIKQLVSTTLQPVFIFTAISLFRAMFLILMQAAIGIAACKICWLEFTLPFGTYCLFDLYFYVPLSLGSAPDAFSFPIANIGIFISMFFVGHAMYTFCDFAAKMGGQIINFQSFNVSDTGIGPGKILSDFKAFSKPVYDIATAPLDILAIDDESRKIRKGARKQRREKHDTNKKD